jgi:hypothetical protein
VHEAPALLLTPQTRTLLSRAVSHVQRSISTVGAISTSVELLVTTALERSADVDKGISLNRERPFRVSRSQNRSGCDATKRGGEGPKVTPSLATVRREGGRRAEAAATSEAMMSVDFMVAFRDFKY